MNALIMVGAAPVAAALLSTAAAAQHSDTGPSSSRQFESSSRFDGDQHSDGRRHGRRSDAVIWVDREWQGDTAWRPESYNDWWHERPNRSFPRWISNNGRCERIWWGGEGWRC